MYLGGLLDRGNDYDNWAKYNYRDFLKLHKISTKKFLGL